MSREKEIVKQVNKIISTNRIDSNDQYAVYLKAKKYDEICAYMSHELLVKILTKKAISSGDSNAE